MVQGFQGHLIFSFRTCSTGSEVPKVKRGECVQCKRGLSCLHTHGLIADAAAADWRSYSAIGSQR